VRAKTDVRDEVEIEREGGVERDGGWVSTDGPHLNRMCTPHTKSFRAAIESGRRLRCYVRVWR
jgi:hypothetical protein